MHSGQQNKGLILLLKHYGKKMGSHLHIKNLSNSLGQDSYQNIAITYKLTVLKLSFEHNFHSLDEYPPAYWLFFYVLFWEAGQVTVLCLKIKDSQTGLL